MRRVDYVDMDNGLKVDAIAPPLYECVFSCTERLKKSRSRVTRCHRIDGDLVINDDFLLIERSHR